MVKVGPIVVSLGTLLFASFSSSSTYQLNSYSVGPGGTNSAGSSTYKLQGSTGEQANGSAAGSTDTAGNGSVQTEQLNVPPAPTLSNGSGAYYNKLQLTINVGNDTASDITFAIAVSTDNFVTTNYVQADGTLNISPVYQTYASWGGSSGSFITGLAASTTYKAKVAAKQGLFTNTEFGAVATQSTAAPSITFSVSPNSLTLSTLLPGSVITSSNLALSLDTNGASGGGVYVSGLNTGLTSQRVSYTIPAFSGNLALQPQGFGVQATSPSQSSGGPLSRVSPFDGSANTVGAESTTPQSMLSSPAAIAGGSANANAQAKASSNTPASPDYSETLTFTAAANF